MSFRIILLSQNRLEFWSFANTIATNVVRRLAKHNAVVGLLVLKVDLDFIRVDVQVLRGLLLLLLASGLASGLPALLFESAVEEHT